MAKVLIKKLASSVKLPTYKTSGASGMDLMAFITEPIILKPQSSCLVPTGISVAFSQEFEIQIRPRSGLAAKNNISVLNTHGTIDSDYRGEIKVILFNHRNKEFIIKNNDRIAQMILTPLVNMELLEKATERPVGIKHDELGFRLIGSFMKAIISIPDAPFVL